VQLHQIYVLERARSGGVGAALLQAVIAEARARGAASLWLGVWSQNPRAVRFYERHGFAIVGSHTFVLGTDAQRDHVMARALVAPR
jgi:ribosomal protein S18 acetylase RimI-like enzyme